MSCWYAETFHRIESYLEMVFLICRREIFVDGTCYRVQLISSYGNFSRIFFFSENLGEGFDYHKKII